MIDPPTIAKAVFGLVMAAIGLATLTWVGVNVSDPEPELENPYTHDTDAG